MCGGDEGQVEVFWVGRGVANVVDVGVAELQRVYCTGASEGRAVACVYSIVHADVA